MPTSDTGARDGTLAILLAQLERAERRADREATSREALLTHQAQTLGQINLRLGSIEAALTSGPKVGALQSEPMTANQWVKLAVGIALPLAALILALSGNIDAARKLLLP